jgi:hypothetical protein
MSISSINRSLEDTIEEVKRVGPRCEWLAVCYCNAEGVTTVIAQRRGGPAATLLIGALMRCVNTLMNYGNSEV